MDPYAVLGVARDSSTDEVRRAYLLLARRIHPDVNVDDPYAAEKMRRVNQAWELLSDPSLRAAVDQRLRRSGGAGYRGSTSASHGPSSPDHGTATDTDPDLDEGLGQHPDEDLDADFDANLDMDEVAITGGQLPAWLRLAAPGTVALGLLVMFAGVVLRAFALLRLGLGVLVLAAVLFMVSPFIVQIRSRGRSLH